MSIAFRLRLLADAVSELPTAPQPPAPSPPPSPPIDPSASLLHQVASTLTLGEWRRVPTVIPSEFNTFKSLQGVRAIPPATGGADGMGWTERLVEHRGALMLLLMRDAFEKSLIHMRSDGVWTRLRQPEGFPTRYERRPFNRLMSDGTYLLHPPTDDKTKMGYMVRTPLDNPGVFERFGIPIGDGQMDTVGNFSMDYADAWGRFFAYTPGGKLYSWADGETKWRDHFSHIPKADRSSGYAGTVRWNPIKREVITIGGQVFGSNADKSHKVLRLTSPDGLATSHEALRPDGEVFKAIRSGSDRFTVHPATGEYLFLYQDGLMYRSHDAVTWRLYQDLNPVRPWGAWEKYCPWTHLSGTPDVLVMVSHIEGVWLHRLKD